MLPITEEKASFLRVDWKSILQSIWLLCFMWLVGVGGAALSGYPGAICITPVGWVLGMLAGMRVVSYSSNPEPARRLVEAGIAGALIGLFEGLLAALILALYNPDGVFKPLSLSNDPLSSLGTAVLVFFAVGGLGALICAGLGVIFGNFQMKKLV